MRQRCDLSMQVEAQLWNSVAAIEINKLLLISGYVERKIRSSKDFYDEILMAKRRDASYRFKI